jgi:8-oxo-dGTP pyrophosphatase MutT (NUDIX family)
MDMQQLARFALRYPKTASALQHIYRRFQPRFTVGAVGVLLDNKNRVLLVEHAFHARYPWGLPGGWVGRNELPSVAVEREFLEETGLSVQVIYPIEVWSSIHWRNHVDLAFAVEFTETTDPIPEPRLSFELTNYQWAERTHLPRIMPIHEHVIDRAIAFRQERSYIPTYVHSEEMTTED